MRHILSILLENEPGALARVVGLFAARAYNIDSLSVATTEDTTMSRMTIVTHGSDDVIEQITKQLNKLIEVVKVVDLTDGNHIERELMLVKVRAAGKDRDEMKRMVDIFRGRILVSDVKNSAAENVNHALHLIAIFACRSHLHQHQFTLDVIAVGQVNHLHHFDQFVQLLGDLLNHVIRAVRDNGHAAHRRVLSRGDRERIDVVGASCEQADHAGQCAGFVLKEDGEDVAHG